MKKEDRELERQLKSLVVLSLGAFLMFFYVFLAGIGVFVDTGNSSDSTEPEIYGSSTVQVGDELKASVLLDNANLGQGNIELHISKPAQIAGAELRFEVTGDLEIIDVYCAVKFVCNEEFSDGVLSLNILHMPEFIDESLSGKVTVATILYSTDSSGELVLNSENTGSSTILTVEAQNIMSDEVQYLSIGQGEY